MFFNVAREKSGRPGRSGDVVWDAVTYTPPTRPRHSPRGHSVYSVSLVNQTAPTSVLDVLHHQYEEGGSGHSGTVFETHVGIWI